MLLAWCQQVDANNEATESHVVSSRRSLAEASAEKLAASSSSNTRRNADHENRKRRTLELLEQKKRSLLLLSKHDDEDEEEIDASPLKNTIRGGGQSQQHKKKDTTAEETTSRIEQTNAMIECNPNDADAGILAACGSSGNSDRGSNTKYYCVESQTSSLGGVCITKKIVPRVVVPSSSSIRGQTEQQQEETMKVPERTVTRQLQTLDQPCTSSCDEGYFCHMTNGWGNGGTCEICPCTSHEKPAYVECNEMHRLGVITHEGSMACGFQCQHDYNDLHETVAENCAEVSPTEFDSCDTSQFTQSTTSGTITCRSEEYCAYGCCYTMSYTETYGPDALANQGISYEFTLPYSQSVEINYVDNRIGPNGTPWGDNCNIVIDGTTCSSCDHVGQCIHFDCSNVVTSQGEKGQIGNTCSDGGFGGLIPIYHQCFAGDGCNVCGDGSHSAGSGNLLFPTNTATVPGYYGRFQCQDIHHHALGRLFGDNGSKECQEVSDVVRHQCCGNGAVSEQRCNICEEYNAGSELDTFWQVAGNTGKNCDDWYFDGLWGNIHTSDCPTIAANLGNQCCSN